MPDQLIGGVISSAPLFNGASLDELQGIVDKLSSVSFGRAGEGRRHAPGYNDMQAVYSELNRLKLSSYAVACIVRHQSQLVTHDELIDGMLGQLRG